MRIKNNINSNFSAEMSRVSSIILLKYVSLPKWYPHLSITVQNLSSYSSQNATLKKDERFYAGCFRTLELDPESSQDLVRRQYIRLVKKYHPDSAQTDSEKEVHIHNFHKIDEVSTKLMRILRNYTRTA